MSNRSVKCRRGDAFAFALRLQDRWPLGIPADYTTAVFEVRETGDEILPALISIDQTTGITIDHAASMIYVSVGATQTADLPRATHDRQLFGQVRLNHATDPDDVVSWVIPRLINRPNGVPL